MWSTLYKNFARDVMQRDAKHMIKYTKNSSKQNEKIEFLAHSSNRFLVYTKNSEVKDLMKTWRYTMVINVTLYSNCGCQVKKFSAFFP